MRSLFQNGNNTVISYLKAIGFSLLISFALLLIACTAAYRTEDPASAAKTASLAALFASSAVSGFISAKITGKGVLSGLITGAALSLILIVLSLSVYGGSDNVSASLLLFSTFIILCAIGALVGRKKKLRKKRKPGLLYKR